MTMMVRDEQDIVVPMIEYHLHAGIDVLLVTDNASVDGTRDLLAAYEDDPRVIVMDHPVHDKNQSERVTEMARRAYTEFGADWVINADADEFFVPVDRGLNLKELFERLPRSLGSASVPVIDMTGRPARHGSGLRRLTRRDLRPEETLYDRAGLLAHATQDAIHIGDPDIRVSQGNHFVSIASGGDLPEDLRLESLHFPWRSFDQFANKVAISGRAYDANPALTPSPRHHGMRDYRFLKAGVLEEVYLYRHPLSAEGAPDDVPVDEWLVNRLAEILLEPDVRHPEVLRAALDDTDDEAYSDAELEGAARVARAVLAIEHERVIAATEARDAREFAKDARRRIEASDALRAEAEARYARASGELRMILMSRPYRISRMFAAPVRVLRAAMRAAVRTMRLRVG